MARLWAIVILAAALVVMVAAIYFKVTADDPVGVGEETIEEGDLSARLMLGVVPEQASGMPERIDKRGFPLEAGSAAPASNDRESSRDSQQETREEGSPKPSVPPATPPAEDGSDPRPPQEDESRPPEPQTQPDPEPPLAPEPEEPETNTAPKPVVYTVVSGDTLYGIVRRAYGTAPTVLVEAVAEANQLADPGALEIGATLTLPVVAGHPRPQSL